MMILPEKHEKGWLSPEPALLHRAAFVLMDTGLCKTKTKGEFYIIGVFFILGGPSSSSLLFTSDKIKTRKNCFDLFGFVACLAVQFRSEVMHSYPAAAKLQR
jgi:hypothetical protein